VAIGHPSLELIDFPIFSFYEHRASYSVGLPHFTLFRNGDEMARKNSKRREWTKKDIRELKTLARAKTPAGKIARSLKRTEGATRQKAFALGLSLDTRG
jgi:NADH:ubiquinone oxidoreductase subunit